MKLKKYFLFAITTVIIISGLLVNAAIAQSGSSESLVSIEFDEGDANVGPLDPDEPEYPGNGGTDESGPLVLNSVSNFYFDKQDISIHVADYPTTTIRPYLQVSDARGTGEGWSVSARASKFKTVLGKDSLFGASMTLKHASCISPRPPKPPPTPYAPVTLEFSGTGLVKIVSAGPDTGIGTWLTRWYTNSGALENHTVILTVPGGTGMKGENIATITWFLSSGPD